jgi:hypothetical protein
MAHHGYVTTDCETGAVTRIQIETEPASVKRRRQDLAIGMQTDLRLRPLRIGSKEFLLPQRAVEIAPFGKALTKAEIRFEQHRKSPPVSDSSDSGDTGNAFILLSGRPAGR